MRSLFPALALFGALTLTSVAYAGPAGLISGSGGGFSGSGTFTATSNGDGSYLIDSITGTGVVGLIDPGAFNSNDNLLFPGGLSVVDSNGFAFSDAQGDTSFNVDIFSPSDGVYYAYLNDSDGFSATIPVTLSLVDSGPSFTPNQRHAYNTVSLVNNDAPPEETFDFSYGTPALTPEPSGLLLLGTGILGAAGVMGRNYFRNQG